MSKKLIVCLLTSVAFLSPVLLTPFSQAYPQNAFAANADSSDAEGYDIVIRNGRVMDPETGLDQKGLNVGIRGKTIAAITSEPLRGKKEIDANGEVVAPGFIDLLSYNPNSYGVWFKIADGVTTNLAMHGAEGTGGDMGRWFEIYDKERPPVNYGGAFLYEAARYGLGLSKYAPASPEQILRLRSLAVKALKDGALGISMSPEYVPGETGDEIEAMMETAKRYGVPVYLHVRYSDMEPPGTNLDALAEALDLARKTGAAIHISHIHSTGGTFSMERSLEMLKSARNQGMEVTACIYPYNFWATYLNSARFDAGWQNRFHIGYQDLQIAGTTERLTAESFKKYRQMGKLAAAYAIPERDVELAVLSPFVMIGSDAILEPGNNNHPRGAGAFSRLLALYVREKKTISLMEALKKMTIMPAKKLEGKSPSLRRKGRLQIGADADIVIFDPDRIQDRATVEHPNWFSEGIDYVLVNGRVVKDPGGLHKEVRAGEAIRSFFSQ